MGAFTKAVAAAAGLASVVQQGVLVRAIELDVQSPDSIKAAARQTADRMMQFYIGNQTGQTPGNLPDPYYWWEAGAMFGQMVEYWSYTGDDSYNDCTQEALLHQASPTRDFMPENQTRTEGNDDQVFWAFAAMSAAEVAFPDPPADQPQWVALAQAVFNEQAGRWDTQSCNGGLRWQIYPFNGGYKYKNSISNGGLFQLAARLARYTRNETYAEWADKVYEWMDQSSLMDTSRAGYEVYDGSAVDNNCAADDVDPIRWTYNIGTMINGCAYMYNYTDGSDTWARRLDGFLNGMDVFFPDSGQNQVMDEVAMHGCNEQDTCTADQPSYKAYLARWLATTTQMAPQTYDRIYPLLQASAKGAAAQCSGGEDGITCGRTWLDGTYDGHVGVGEQMSALSVIQANLIQKVAPPVDSDNGGTSEGNPNAGTGNGAAEEKPDKFEPPTKAGMAAAWLLTVGVLLSLAGGGAWAVHGDD